MTGAGLTPCESDQPAPNWFTDEPDCKPVCSSCREPVYHDGERWVHVIRP